MERRSLVVTVSQRSEFIKKVRSSPFARVSHAVQCFQAREGATKPELWRLILALTAAHKTTQTAVMDAEGALRAVRERIGGLQLDRDQWERISGELAGELAGIRCELENLRDVREREERIRRNIRKLEVEAAERSKKCEREKGYASGAETDNADMDEGRQGDVHVRDGLVKKEETANDLDTTIQAKLSEISEYPVVKDMELQQARDARDHAMVS